MPQTDAIKLRNKLGVGVDTILSPKKPHQNIIKENILEILSHEAIFTPEECARIVKENTPESWLTSKTNSTAGDSTAVVRSEYRNSLNNWVQPSPDNMWLFDKVLAMLLSANQRFQFEVDMFEAIQLARYDPGMFYDWHLDIGPGQMGNRKLSVTVQLTDPDSYEGGELLLENLDNDFVASRAIGSVTVFPSFMKHKVMPVTYGIRHSLVVWASGVNRFR